MPRLDPHGGVIMYTLIPQTLQRYLFDHPSVVIVSGYAVVLASLITSLLSDNWEWLQSSGCVLGLCGWYHMETSAAQIHFARGSFVLGSLIWSYTTLLLS
jgi:hypothetical protein